MKYLLLFFLYSVTVVAIAQQQELVGNITINSYNGKSYIYTGSVTIKAPSSGSVSFGAPFFIKPAEGSEVPKNIPPSLSENFVRIETIHVSGITNEDQIISLVPGDKLVQYQYADKAGRATQIVSQGISPLGNDLVKFNNYDATDGRIYEDYLPYVVQEKNGAIKANTVSDVTTFYNGDSGIPADSKPFSKTVYEKSPLNRVNSAFGPGALWQDHGKSSTNSVRLNVDNTVRRWSVDDVSTNPTPQSDGYYPAGTLTYTVTTSEEGYVTKAYTDYWGNTVLVDQQGLQTYYVYNGVGLLQFVLPPELSKLYTTATGIVTPAQELLEKWAFQYRYDDQLRLEREKGPGTHNDWVFYVYDQWDRLVASQDGVQRSKSPQEWSFVKYDALNRPIITGVFKTTISSQGGIVSSVSGNHHEDGDQSSEGYTVSNTFPRTSISGISSVDILAITYYDDYGFRTLTNWSDNNAAYAPDNGLPALTTIYGETTGSKTKLLNGNGWLNSVIYYDDKYRPVQLIERNHLSSTPDRITNTYDFSGQVLQSQRKHYNPYTSSTTTITESYEYDHAGRLKKNYHQIDSSPKVLVAAYNYNELGQLIESNLHSTDGGNTFLQSVDYRYNIRGWLTSINNSTLSNDGGVTNNDTGDLFGLNLTYNQDAFSINDTTTGKLYDGRITAARWSSDNRKTPVKERIYGYSYEAQQRFLQAKYAAKENGSWTGDAGLYDLAVTYNDDHGNIKTLQRYSKVEGAKILIDNLDYNYGSNGNELTAVDDLTNNNFGYPDKTDGLSVELDYDKNGNLTSDLNSEVTSVTYNMLNLPESILIDLPSPELDKKIEYQYDASGYVVRKIYKKGGQPVRTVDYVHGIQYYDQELSIIFTSEGRATAYNGGYEYEYFFKDHLSNTRVVFGYMHETDVFKATMEGDADVSDRETSQFQNILQSRNVGYNHTRSSQESVTPDKAARLSGYGSNPVAIGPAKMMQVKNGDKVNLEVYAKVSAATSSTSVVNGFASLVTTALGGSAQIGEQAAQALNQNLPLYAATQNTGAPKAYLFYIIFNNNYTTVTQWGAASVESLNTEQLLTLDVTVPADGYLFTYVANETSDPAVLAYFDDFKIVHHKVNASLRVTEVTDYDPFGYVLEGTNFVDESRIDNNYKYQGDFAEYENWTGWGRFEGRGNYDTRLGRWHSVDPYSQYASLYAGMGNDYINSTDPNGGFVNFLVAFGVGAVGGGIYSMAMGADVDETLRNVMIGGLVGVGAYGASFVNWSSVGSVIGNAINTTGPLMRQAAPIMKIGGGGLVHFSGAGTPSKSPLQIDPNEVIATNPLPKGSVVSTNQRFRLFGTDAPAPNPLERPVSALSWVIGNGLDKIIDMFNTFGKDDIGLQPQISLSRGLWRLTEEGSKAIKTHRVWGKFFKSTTDNLWWSVDKYGHGGSKFKVFKETSEGLEWYKDADEFGDFIKGKHKGETGTFIPWSEFKTVK